MAILNNQNVGWCTWKFFLKKECTCKFMTNWRYVFIDVYSLRPMKSTILIFLMPSFACRAVSFYMQITSYHLLIGWAVEIQHLTSRTAFFVGFFFWNAELYFIYSWDWGSKFTLRRDGRPWGCEWQEKRSLALKNHLSSDGMHLLLAVLSMLCSPNACPSRSVLSEKDQCRSISVRCSAGAVQARAHSEIKAWHQT